MRAQLLAGLRAILVITVLCGLAYPLVVTGLAQALFHDKADGSLVKVDGTVVGSKLIGQSFTESKYFHPRPSAAGDAAFGVANGDLSAVASGASNYGPTNKKFLHLVAQRVAAYRDENNLSDGTKVPVDAVTASGSGLDPEISIANARLQAARVAEARGIDVATVDKLIDEHTDGRSLGFLGEKGVNVLEVNLALDRATH